VDFFNALQTSIIAGCGKKSVLTWDLKVTHRSRKKNSIYWCCAKLKSHECCSKEER
jgi:hypothetical protein